MQHSCLPWMHLQLLLYCSPTSLRCVCVRAYVHMSVLVFCFAIGSASPANSPFFLSACHTQINTHTSHTYTPILTHTQDIDPILSSLEQTYPSHSPLYLSACHTYRQASSSAKRCMREGRNTDAVEGHADERAASVVCAAWLHFCALRSLLVLTDRLGRVSEKIRCVYVCVCVCAFVVCVLAALLCAAVTAGAHR